MDIDAIVIENRDNVGTALKDLEKGKTAKTRVGGDIVEIPIVCKIPYGHKFAVREIARGEAIIKYGEVIGVATDVIHAGQHAHVKNIKSNRGRGDLSGGR